MNKYLNPVIGTMHELNMENPEPGIYQGVLHQDYLSINAVSRSSLFDFSKSPEAYLYGNDETTEAMTIGTQYHTFLLQPDEWETEFVEGPEYARSKADKEMRLALQSEHGLDNVYRPSTLKQFHAMKEALKNYPKAEAVLLHESEREMVVIGFHEESGLMCKIKIDSPKIDAGWMIDLKTSGEHPYADVFYYSAKKYGYLMQAGFYALVCSLVPGLGHMTNFEIIAQGKKPPYVVRQYNMEQFVSQWIIESNRLLCEFKKWLDEGSKLPDGMTSLTNYSL